MDIQRRIEGVLILCALTILLIANNTLQQGTYLRAANIVYRHGDRNPIHPYRGDIYSNESYWPEGWGALTQRGKLRLYNLGKYMRRRYPNFQRKNVSIFSSDRNRTITSAMANIAGFYGQNRSFLKQLDSYKPKGFGINVVNKDDDDFIMLTKACPKWIKILNDFLSHSETSQSFIREHRQDLDILEQNTGLKFNSFNIDLVFVSDTLVIEKQRYGIIPDWAERLYSSGKLELFRNTLFQMMLHTMEMKRIRTGGLIRRFLNEMEEVIESSVKSDAKYPPPKITIISGHDTTVVHWLNPLGLFDGIAPHYGAAIFLELHELNQYNKSKVDVKADGAEEDYHERFIVKVFFKNESDIDPFEMNLPQCPHPCYFAEFKKTMKPFVIKDFKEECFLDPGDYSSAGELNPLQDSMGSTIYQQSVSGNKSNAKVESSSSSGNGVGNDVSLKDMDSNNDRSESSVKSISPPMITITRAFYIIIFIISSLNLS